MTCSILGREPASGAVGGAVQSAWFGIGAGVVRAEAAVGAVVSQALGAAALGHVGLELLAAGSPPDRTIAALVASDATPGLRQLGALDLASTPAAFTGADCVPVAGHHVGVDCVAQANMMAEPGVPQAMVAAFESTTGDLVVRLLAALDAAAARGGDFRGVQAAGLLVRTGSRGAPEWETTLVDARIDDHPDPLTELRRLVGLGRAYGLRNLPLERLAAGDTAGAVDAARELCAGVGDDPNAQLRLGLALAAAGEVEGFEVLAALAARSERWLVYLRAICRLHDIDPDPVLDRLR